VAEGLILGPTQLLFSGVGAESGAFPVPPEQKGCLGSVQRVPGPAPGQPAAQVDHRSGQPVGTT